MVDRWGERDAGYRKIRREAFRDSMGPYINNFHQALGSFLLRRHVNWHSAPADIMIDRGLV